MIQDSISWGRLCSSETDAEIKIEAPVVHLKSTLEKGRGWSRVGQRGNQIVKHTWQSLATPVGKLWSKYYWSELTCIKLKWPDLITPTAPGIPVQAALCRGDLQCAGICRPDLEGADCWRLPADHTPGSWATSLSLKEVLHSVALCSWNGLWRETDE